MISSFLRGSRSIAAIIALIVVYVVGILTVHGFGGFGTVRSILLLGAFLGIASVGQTFVVLLGGIDLSIPFLMDFGNVVAAQMNGAGHPFGITLLIVLAAAVAIGAISGAISSILDIHPLIVTLGIGYAVQGSILLWTKGFPGGSAPPGLLSFVSIGAHTGPIALPPIAVLWLGVVVAAEWVLQRTVYGRRVYAQGTNPLAARLALVPRVPTWMITFGLSGAFAALAGVFLLGFTGSAFGDVGSPYLFETVAAVVVGGTALIGGQGRYLSTVVGTLLVTEVTLVMDGLGLLSSIEEVVLGAAVVALVGLYGREAHVRERL